MGSTLKAIETTGSIDEAKHLRLDADLPISGPMRVRVIVLYPGDEEWSEEQWLKAAASNPAFAFLADEEEDIYTLDDGKPFHDEV